MPIIILAIFLLPISPSLEIENNKSTFSFVKNEARAETAIYNEYVQGDDLNLKCSLFPTNIPGCIAEVFYAFWRISAWVARIAGHFLDFLIYYSTDSNSYKNNFITNGWGAVRDVVNIFFIIALLYIAIKTILSLNTSNNKKLISYIIIIALIINFSLFVTKVVIDSSNILAKVFYNNISPENESKAAVTGAKGEKSISAGLVSKFNPQKILTQGFYDETGVFVFILITLVLTAITLYTAYIFFSVAILFVGRVVSLWISMIFSPLAFASYTLPFDIPGFGHKEWWKLLLESAFLAPIFVFLLYIIVMFAGFLSDIISYPDDADLTQKIMSIIIPFFILMILLQKAKTMAVKYSGEMGAAVSKVGAFVGGAAVGLAAGGLAFAGRKTIGAAGSRLANSEWAKNNGRIGRMVGNAGKFASKSSFDARGIKVAGKDLASTGLKVNTLGKPKEGGYEKAKADKMEKRIKRAKELEVGPNEQIAKDVRRAEIVLDDIKSDPIRTRDIAQKTKDIAGSEKELEAANREVAAAERAVADAERAVKDAIDKFGATSVEADTARNTRDTAINGPGGRNDKISFRDTKQAEVTAHKANLKVLEQPIRDAEKVLTEAQNVKAKVSKDRQTAYAESLRNSPMNYFTAGGFAGADEAADKIRARSAADNKQQVEKK